VFIRTGLVGDGLGLDRLERIVIVVPIAARQEAWKSQTRETQAGHSAADPHGDVAATQGTRLATSRPDCQQQSGGEQGECAQSDSHGVDAS